MLTAVRTGTRPGDPAADRLARALAALSACNKAVAAAISEPDLLERACQAMVEAGGYPFGWVGYARPEGEAPLRPVAQFGTDPAVEPVPMQRTFAPMEAAMRTGSAQVVRHASTETDLAPPAAHPHGRVLRSCVALPLLVEGECLGALTLYALEPDAFDDGEVLMLGQAAEDLALGIARQRADAGRLHAEYEQQKTAAALRVQTALLDQLFESAAEAIVLLDLDDRVIRVNPEFTRMFGYTSEESIGRPLNDLIAPATRLGEARRLTLEVGQGRQCTAESVRRRKDGSTLHVSILGAPIYSGEVQIASYATYRDISERRRIERMQARRVQEAALRGEIQAAFTHAAGNTEEALRRTAELLARQLEYALVRIWTFEGGAPALEVQASSCSDGRSLLGRSFIEPDSTLIAAVVHDRVAYVSNELPPGSALECAQRTLGEGMATIAGYPLVIDGGLAGVLGLYAPQPLEPDMLETLESIAGTIAQCIARQRAQEALRASEERFRAIVAQQTDLICRFRPDATLTFVNDAYARHFGRSPQELVGRSFLELIPEEQQAAARAHIESLCANPRVVAYEHAAIAADGRLRWHQWIDQLVPDAEGRGFEFQSVGRDVTERRAAEEALLRSEQIARAQAAELDAVNAALRAEIVERRRAEQLARTHSSVITGTLRSLTVEPKLDVFIGQVLKAIADELGAVCGAFWTYDPATDLMHLQFNYERGTLTRQVAAQEPWQFPRRAPPVDAGRTDPEVVIYSDADIDNSPVLAPLRDYLRANGIHHVIAVRLFFGGQFFGTYSARFVGAEPLSEDQINLARALAQEATLAIALARLEAQAREAATATERERAARERATQLAQCNAILHNSLQVLASQPRQELFLAHVLETIGATLDAHSCALWRLSPDGVLLALALTRGQLMQPEEASTSPVARAFAQAVCAEPALLQLMARPTAYVIEDLVTTQLYPEPVKQALLQLGARSVTSVPMRIGDQVLGRFEVRLGHSGMLALHDLEILEALANQVALALHMTRLAEENRQAAVFAERNRLARDIHDTLAQGFTGVIVQLEAAMDAIGHHRRRESDRHIERAAELARRSLAEARRSVHALRPLALESEGVGSALQRLLATMTTGTGIDARFHTTGVARTLPPEWEENLLRIGQEALANALKHAAPRHIRVELRFDAEQIGLSLRDDGAGFDPAAPASGMGLAGMRERAARLGWRLEVHSRIGQGSEVFVGLPPPV